LVDAIYTGKIDVGDLNLTPIELYQGMKPGKQTNKQTHASKQTNTQTYTHTQT